MFKFWSCAISRNDTRDVQDGVCVLISLFMYVSREGEKKKDNRVLSLERVQTFAASNELARLHRLSTVYRVTTRFSMPMRGHYNSSILLRGSKVGGLGYVSLLMMSI